MSINSCLPEETSHGQLDPDLSLLEGDKISKSFIPWYAVYRYVANLMKAQVLRGIFITVGVGTLLRPERDAWSVVK